MNCSLSSFSINMHFHYLLNCIYCLSSIISGNQQFQYLKVFFFLLPLTSPKHQYDFEFRDFFLNLEFFFYSRLRSRGQDGCGRWLLVSCGGVLIAGGQWVNDWIKLLMGAEVEWRRDWGSGGGNSGGAAAVCQWQQRGGVVAGSLAEIRLWVHVGRNEIKMSRP